MPAQASLPTPVERPPAAARQLHSLTHMLGGRCVHSACAPPPKKAKVHQAGKALAALGSVGAVASFLTPLGATLGVYAQAFSGATVESTVAAFAASRALDAAVNKGLDMAPMPSSTAELVVPVLASLYLVVSVLLGLSVRRPPVRRP